MNNLRKNIITRKAPSVRYWTKSAIECYERNCNCEGCHIKELINEPCQMKASVLALYSKFGAPQKEQIFSPDLSDSENKIINLILNGATTKEQLAKEMELRSVGRLSFFLCPIYVFLENKGVKLTYHNKFNETVEYIQTHYKSEEVVSDFNPENVIIEDEMEEDKMYQDDDLNIEYPERYKKVIDCIKMGYLKFTEICNYSALTSGAVCSYLNNFAKDLESKGLIQPSKMSSRERVVNFVQSRVLDNEYIQPAADAQAKTEEKVKEEKPKTNAAAIETSQPLAEEPLTEQEANVINLLLDGYSFQEIANKLVIALSTVKTHVDNIYSKKNYHSLQDLLCSEFKQRIKEVNKQPFEVIEENLKADLAKVQQKLNAIAEVKEMFKDTKP